MNKTLRNLAISAQPLIVSVLTALVKATNDQQFTQATAWIIAAGVVSGLLAMYLHFLTTEAGAAVPTPPPGPTP